VSPDYTILNPKPEINTQYYSFLLRTEAYKTEVNRRSYGVVDDRNRIYWKQFGSLPLLYPSPDEQQMIVEEIQNTQSRIDDLRLKINSVIKALQERRRSLMINVITGQIDVTETQNPELETTT
jgi:type I restriction enzyme S subunit